MTLDRCGVLQSSRPPSPLTSMLLVRGQTVSVCESLDPSIATLEHGFDEKNECSHVCSSPTMQESFVGGRWEHAWVWYRDRSRRMNTVRIIERRRLGSGAGCRERRRRIATGSE